MGNAKVEVRVVRGRRKSSRRLWPVSSLEFRGCHEVPMTRSEYYGTDRRVEFWDSATETAFEARDTFAPHERGSRRLVHLIHRIDRARGASCGFLGSTSFQLRDRETGEIQTLQPDESVYLDARRADRIGKGPGELPWIEVGSDEFPDVVLEVDHTTDVRRSKLQLYEAWGTPELWVEVPDDVWYTRPRGLTPGVRIHLLEGDRYRRSDVSRAFPGWRAEEIHRGLNEDRMSEATLAVLDRVGRALAKRYGTSAEDDLQTKAFLDQGREEGLLLAHLGILDSCFVERGIGSDPTFPDRLSPADRRLVATARPGAVLRAARAAANEDDFLRRLARQRRRPGARSASA